MNDITKLFNKASLEVLKVLSMSDKMYLREIAEKTGISPATIHGVMAYFRMFGFVNEYREKNRVFFSLNMENLLLLKVKSLQVKQQLLV